MARWNYKLKSGNSLRSAIRDEDPYAVLDELKVAYQELLQEGLIDEDDYEEYVEQFDWYSDEDDDEFMENVDYELSEFYDLCDNIGVWVGGLDVM